MLEPFRRRRRVLPALLAVVFVLVAAAILLRPSVERTLRARLEGAAGRRGFDVRIGDLRAGLWPPLRLRDVVVEKPGRLRLEIGRANVWWRGHVRVEALDAVLRGPAGLAVAADATTWDVLASGETLQVALSRPVRGLALKRAARPGGATWTIEATDLPVSRVLDIERSNRLLFDGGTVRGALEVIEEAGDFRFDLGVAARSARLPVLEAEEAPPADTAADGAGEPAKEGTAGEAARDPAADDGGVGAVEPPLGEPLTVLVDATGAWSRSVGTFEVPHFGITLGGATLSGGLGLRGLPADPAMTLSLEAEQVDFARLLRVSGLPAPEGLDVTARPGDGALGTAELTATAEGRLAEPASFVVTQDLRFTPPTRMPRAIERLRGNFIHEVPLSSGGRRGIEVSEASADFIALQDVPPLFVRTLLLAEDAGFYGHRGIDLREMPAAVLTDLARGEAVRGASTITQQLAKNLFLTRDRRVGRKLQELSVAMLLETAIGKNRILEIYLNVIEWGPDLHGLRPAARAYFAREPADLTPAQMAFLVSLIPAPVKYQVSFKDGTPGPGLRQLVDALLAKVRSVDALSEEEYRAALAEPLLVQGRGGPPAADPAAAPAPETAPGG